MAKITTIPPGRDPDDKRSVYDGCQIELRGCSVTIQAASARTVYELVHQLMEWGTEANEAADKHRDLVRAALKICDEARHASWGITGQDEVVKPLSKLVEAWEDRIAELEAAARAYDDSWTHFATLLDTQEIQDGTRRIDLNVAFRKLLEEANEGIDSDDNDVRTPFWGGVLLALTIYERATGVNWGLYDPKQADTDPYFV